MPGVWRFWQKSWQEGASSGRLSERQSLNRRRTSRWHSTLRPVPRSFRNSTFSSTLIARPVARTVLLAAHPLMFRLLLTSGCHTRTQVLAALGIGNLDWDATSHLFNLSLLDTVLVSTQFFQETHTHFGPYVVAFGGTPLPQHRQRLPGTSWPFRPLLSLPATGTGTSPGRQRTSWLGPGDRVIDREVKSGMKVEIERWLFD